MNDVQKRCIQLKACRHVIDGGAEGKVVQFCVNGQWSDWNPLAGEINFTAPTECYRLKPEPKYRPFTPEEGLQHEGRRIRPMAGVSNSNKPFVIWAVGRKGFVDSDGTYARFDNCLEEWEFEDGTRCGVMVE